MIEALADGGVLAGLSRDLAAELAARAVLVSLPFPPTDFHSSMFRVPRQWP